MSLAGQQNYAGRADLDTSAPLSKVEYDIVIARPFLSL